jgi:hypothetical protein
MQRRGALSIMRRPATPEPRPTDERPDQSADPLRRLRLAPRLRRGCGHELPLWVLAEVCLDAAQAAWRW